MYSLEDCLRPLCRNVTINKALPHFNGQILVDHMEYTDHNVSPNAMITKEICPTVQILLFNTL